MANFWRGIGRHVKCTAFYEQGSAVINSICKLRKLENLFPKKGFEVYA